MHKNSSKIVDNCQVSHDNKMLIAEGNVNNELCKQNSNHKTSRFIKPCKK